ncbi:MAG TPA: hypothetical protein VGZ32_10485 [Actinocrinis sp.]|uniref:hypothetical protein n=1 Tax=Actinocrinis sp. TaxID=1920516 RepID=UPI002DDC9951|nr:hypothetical protein [Actinocrinis sp.]HEV3170758.1 hypothetical protein [Actinocrinis sp.]
MRVHLLAWGFTAADVEHAVDKAGQGWARETWEFVEVERFQEVPCPLNIKDPAAIAAAQGYHWAYVAYTAEDAQ